MNTPDKVPYIRILAVLGAAYPNFVLPDESGEVYLSLLMDIPAKTLERATLEHIACSKFYPTIGELRQAAFDLLEASNPLPEGHEAWQAVMAEVERVGHAGKPEFDSPLIAKAVETLGWRTICLSDNVTVERAHFMQVYSGLIAKERDQLRRLPDGITFLKPAGENRLLDDGK